MAGIAEASVKTQWGFGSSRGAVLIMHEPQTSYIPGELLQRLAQSPADCLKEKILVTDVSSCSSYAMYLSAGSESSFLHRTLAVSQYTLIDQESVKIALLATIPTITPGIAAGGGIGAGWWSSSHDGIFEHAHEPTASFFPLCAMKALWGKTRRGAGTSESLCVFKYFIYKVSVGDMKKALWKLMSRGFASMKMAMMLFSRRMCVLQPNSLPYILMNIQF